MEQLTKEEKKATLQDEVKRVRHDLYLLEVRIGFYTNLAATSSKNVSQQYVNLVVELKRGIKDNKDYLEHIGSELEKL